MIEATFNLDVQSSSVYCVIPSQSALFSILCDALSDGRAREGRRDERGAECEEAKISVCLRAPQLSGRLSEHMLSDVTVT